MRAEQPYILNSINGKKKKKVMHKKGITKKGETYKNNNN